MRLLKEAETELKETEPAAVRSRRRALVSRRIFAAATLVAAFLLGLALLQHHRSAGRRIEQTAPDGASKSLPAVAPTSTPPPEPAATRPVIASQQAGSGNSQQILQRLREVGARPLEITPEAAENWRRDLRALVHERRAAIPALWEFLAGNEDVRYDSGTGPNLLGEPTLRIALLTILPQLPAPENLELEAKLLRATSDHEEIALLARQLRQEEPAKYSDVIVRTVRAALVRARNEQQPPASTASLAEILASYGVEEIPPAISADAEGVLCTGQIGGFVWLDADGDGALGATETGLSGITVLLYDRSDLFRLEVATDATGWYEFNGLCAGDYKVYLEPSALTDYRPTTGAGTRVTNSSSIPASVTLTSPDQTARSTGFGFQAAAPVPPSATPAATMRPVAVSSPAAAPTESPSLPPRPRRLSYSAREWAAAPNAENAGMLLQNNFTSVYSEGAVQIGGRYSARFQSAAAVRTFLTSTGAAAALTEDHVDPKPSTLENKFAREVLALRLNVDFSQAGKLPAGFSRFKLRTTALKGWTVFDVLSLANLVLGGGTSPQSATIGEINAAVATINGNFESGSDKGDLAAEESPVR